jgi:hypothetical protein
MPIVTRWFIKTSLMYLIAALVLGVAETAQAPLGLPAGLAVTGSVYVHLLVVGWITQMIFGVAYWMFPKYSKETPRGSDRLATASYVCLNAGLLLRVLGEPAHRSARGCKAPHMRTPGRRTPRASKRPRSSMSRCSRVPRSGSRT